MPDKSVNFIFQMPRLGFSVCMFVLDFMFGLKLNIWFQCLCFLCMSFQTYKYGFLECIISINCFVSVCDVSVQV